ncbi:cytochrome-c peroxidase [Pleionea sediminis]|uniref:cytochrome-c peroxidase n=1 Tax=Pleionea sediminis TaxID=2569479 RepID=UPI0011869689|nr:cytochrome c peroxidase [Pleionea sediminis]
MDKGLSLYQKGLKLSLVSVVTSMLLSGCDSSSHLTNEQKLDKQLQDKIEVFNLTGDPSKNRNLPTIEEPLSQLGMKLFFSKALSGEMDVACVTCHHPVLGGGDNLSLPIGVDAEFSDLLGDGRHHSSSGDHYDGGPTVPRNAPTTFNIGMWDKVLFHDGRVESLGGTPGQNGNDGQGIRTPDSSFGTADENAGENLTIAQSRFPVTSPEEMKNFGAMDGTTNSEIRAYLQQRLGSYGTPPGLSLFTNTWLEEFQSAFEQPTATAEELITFENITKAIGTYENSQVFINNDWKEYIEGKKDALSESEKRGAILFFSSKEEKGANCVSCHSGDFFTDEDFHNIGMIQMGRGKGDGEKGNNDFGRYRETSDENDRFAFRTPSLLNVEVTGPWGHAGAYTTLEAVVRHHLNPQIALDNYDWSQIDPNIQAVDMVTNTQMAIDKLNSDRTASRDVIEIIDLSDEEIDDLVAFLKTLTDPCVLERECLSDWIPDASDSNPDAMRLNAVDNNGDYL